MVLDPPFRVTHSPSRWIDKNKHNCNWGGVAHGLMIEDKAGWTLEIIGKLWTLWTLLKSWTKRTLWKKEEKNEHYKLYEHYERKKFEITFHRGLYWLEKDGTGSIFFFLSIKPFLLVIHALPLVILDLSLAVPSQFQDVPPCLVWYVSGLGFVLLLYFECNKFYIY